MKYDHVVKVNGVFYPAGQEVPGHAERTEGVQPSVRTENTEKPVERRNTMPKQKKDE